MTEVKEMKLENVPTIRDLLDIAPEKHNDRTFIKYIRDDKIVEKKFSEVRSDGLAICRKLRHELPEKTHIAIISKSTYEYIACMTGVLTSGHVAVPIDPDSTAAEAAAIINDSDSTVLFCGEEFSDRIDEVKALCPALSAVISITPEDFGKIYEDFSESSPYAALSDKNMEPSACCLIIYTSGTTGDKKGVMLSSESLVSNLIFDPYDPIVIRVDTILSVLPLHHIFCFICGYLGPLKIGNCVCLNGEMKDLFKNFLVFKPNQIRVVPLIAQGILARIRAIQAKNPDLSPKEAAAMVTGGNLDLMLAGGAYLVYRKVISVRIPAAYLGSVAVLTLVFSKTDAPVDWMLYSLFSGGLMLGAIFMATDYATSPVTAKGQIIYGIGCGILTVVFRYFGLFPEGVTYAILLMNALVWIIDRYTAPRRFGVKKGGK